MIELFDTALLSRIQFAFTISFHIIFPAFTIGLASWLAFIEGMWLKTKHPIYLEIFQFWVKIFAVTFGMGVVSGLVMVYQFGTNWAEFADHVGNVIGPLLGFEVLTAFFLEASFLGIMLFGMNRVGPKMHFTATILVAVGTLLSAFWILAANSWMQTPQGFEVAENGILLPTNWLEILFNPSFPYRFFHMVFAAFLTTALVVSGVSSWYLLKGRYVNHARIMLSKALLCLIVLIPIQLYVGDASGLNTLEHQPEKIAAMEGVWEDESPAALVLFGIPSEKTQSTEYAIKIPHLASLILTHSWDGEVKGLKNWDREDRPPVWPVFFSFRIMVGMGLLMLFTALWALYLFFRKRLYSSTIFHRWCVLMTPAGFIAILTGWFVTEIGRQPYVVYGVLRTADMVSPITPHEVAWSLATFVVVYLSVFGAGIYYIFRLINKGLEVGEWHDAYGQHALRYPTTLADVFLVKPPKGK